MIFSVIVGILCTLAVAPGLAMAGLTASQTVGIFQDLPGSIQIGQLPQRNRIFANGPSGPVQVATVYDQNREEDSWDQISPYLKDAAIDGEDKGYYSHGGVDVGALIRAAATNVGAGSVQSGASTIAMQVVRNVEMEDALKLKTPAARKAAYKVATEDTLPRKLKEMRLAIGLEKEFSKRQILNEYLNIANFGGITTASRLPRRRTSRPARQGDAGRGGEHHRNRAGSVNEVSGLEGGLRGERIPAGTSSSARCMRRRTSRRRNTTPRRPRP